MTRYSLHGGHNSIVQGANCGSRKEHIMDRQVKDAVAAKLRALGHTVYDDTDEMGSTQARNLSNIVANCNSHTVDLVISFHLNAFNGTANGVEVCYYDQQGLATKVSGQLSKDIGWKDRGAIERKELYVLAHTEAPAILIELGFIDNDNDMAKWDVDKIANSIVYALTGQSVGTNDESKYIVTGGLRLQACYEISQYLLERNWWGKMEFTTNGDAFVTTGGIYEPQLSEFRTWMDQKGWYYEVR
ncbi:N-acetylmuramoyl-L-alanine amidase [Bacillus cereus group sp. Bc222]|uniref:N-acetylmuramoyl-L-alanine amidase n=1 Tax=Bacillus cereus group sp. Bc222 TaxID=3018111 RepID=UPI0022E78906|nr:N-acetylmuramoyl-L-alanine amidase [Bacillus cereus group sp. Bc222]MDA2241739.1 N-acetylmuramoyl-L-alanine amidase [Bacillus cereus group sp. Bc222]